MNLCITLNEKYFKYMFIMIESFIKNNQGNHTIYIMYSELKHESIMIANDFLQKRGCIAVWVHEDIDKYRDFPMRRNWSYETYFLLRASELLPNSLQRVLYLDIDLIVCGSLDELYNIDFGDNYIAARKNILDSGDAVELYCTGKTFLNSGVVLMNLEKIREDIGFDDYVAAAKEMQYEFYMDEALLSYVMYGKVKFFDCKYNYWLGCETQDPPIIIHYICPENPYKPWDLLFTENEIKQLNQLKRSSHFMISNDINELFKIWWKYAENTPYYEQLEREVNVKTEWFIRSIYDYIVKSEGVR